MEMTQERTTKKLDAGIWAVGTLRRRLRIGVITRVKIDVKRVRQEFLAAYIWKEESTRIEGGDGEEKQTERRTKQTGTGTIEIEEEREKGQGETEATQKTWGDYYRHNKKNFRLATSATPKQTFGTPPVRGPKLSKTFATFFTLPSFSNFHLDKQFAA